MTVEENESDPELPISWLAGTDSPKVTLTFAAPPPVPVPALKILVAVPPLVPIALVG